MPGEAVALSGRVVRLTADNPGMMTGPGTNSYLVGRGDRVVIDPGPDDARHVQDLVDCGDGAIRFIVVTHTHVDHSPAAAALAERTGAELIGFDARDDFSPDRSVSDGFTLTTEGVTLRALHTPGHASNHLCWLLVEELMLFSGDHIMGGSTVVIAPTDGDMAVYLDSLRRLLALDPPLATIAPGHGPLLRHPSAAIEGVIAHRLAREEQIAAALTARHTATVDELLASVYRDVRDELLPVARKSLWAHLRKLVADRRAGCSDPDDVDSLWTALA